MVVVYLSKKCLSTVTLAVATGNVSIQMVHLPTNTDTILILVLLKVHVEDTEYQRTDDINTIKMPQLNNTLKFITSILWESFFTHRYMR